MKKSISFTLIIALFFNLISPSLSFAQDGAHPYLAQLPKTPKYTPAQYAQSLHTEISMSIEHMGPIVEKLGTDFYAFKATRTQSYGHILSRAMRLTTYIQEIEHYNLWDQVDEAFRKNYGQNSTEYKFFEKYHPKSHPLKYTRPETVTAMHFVEDVNILTDVAAKQSNKYLSEEFLKNLKKLQTASASEVAAAKIDMTQTAKKLLAYKDFNGVMKNIYPNATPKDAQTFTRLMRVYLESFHAEKTYVTAKGSYVARGNKITITPEAAKTLRPAPVEQWQRPGANQQFIERVIASEADPRVRNVFRNIKSSTTNILVLCGMTVLSIVLMSSANAANDAEFKTRINNAMADTIRNQSKISAAVKENPNTLPLLTETQKNNILNRKDILTEDQKLLAALNYVVFVKRAESNPSYLKAVLEDMKKEDEAVAAQDYKDLKEKKSEGWNFEKYNIDTSVFDLGLSKKETLNFPYK
ncbi:hypothetical protein Dip510_000117 [Elusimicrobium posterum]|uniref:hypothetical protein n=1 Tax=Elusimicrobium posterum TaxID=3116653 RepID=UPI003C775668